MTEVCASESSAVEYLRKMGVFSTMMMCSENACGWRMKSDIERMHWRRYKKNCRKKLSIRSENRFFHYTEASGRQHSRLKLHKILELLDLFLYTRGTVAEACYIIGRSRQSIVD